MAPSAAGGEKSTMFAVPVAVGPAPQSFAGVAVTVIVPVAPTRSTTQNTLPEVAPVCGGTVLDTAPTFIRHSVGLGVPD